MILPLTYLGNIEYFFQFWKEDKISIDIQEPFQKQTYRSRCNILGANGKLTLSVPVERPNGKDSLMNEVLISNAENWRKDHLKAIESAYARTPYFEYYFDRIKEIIEHDYKTLAEMNLSLTKYFIEKLGIDVDLEITDQSQPILEKDYRKNFTSKKESGFNTYRYIQPFEERHGFIGNLSILDLLFNEGPNSISILQESSYSER